MRSRLSSSSPPGQRSPDLQSLLGENKGDSRQGPTDYPNGGSFGDKREVYLSTVVAK